jgi:hypothetical protein
VKRTKVLATLLIALSLATSGCGNSDSIKSLLLTSTGTSSGSTYNLPGVDSTLQLKVWAVYNSGKQIDVTNKATWNVATVGTDDQHNPLPPYGPDSVPINATGLMTAIAQICTWADTMNTTATPPVLWNPPVWVYTGYYQTTASYRGFTSQPIGIGVGVTTSNAPAGGCGPS